MPQETCRTWKKGAIALFVATQSVNNKTGRCPLWEIQFDFIASQLLPLWPAFPDTKIFHLPNAAGDTDPGYSPEQIFFRDKRTDEPYTHIFIITTTCFEPQRQKAAQGKSLSAVSSTAKSIHSQRALRARSHKLARFRDSWSYHGRELTSPLQMLWSKRVSSLALWKAVS